MKKLNTKHLFNIFQTSDEEIYAEHHIDTKVANTFILFGTVIKGVENYYILDQLHINKYGKEYLCQRDSIKLTYFSSLMKYLERIVEIEEDTVCDLVDEFGVHSIQQVLQEMLALFTESEHYEKCVILCKFRNSFY